MPLLLVLVMAVVQFALAEYATHLAQATASQALAAARVRDGSSAAGRAEAALVLGRLNHGVLRDPHVQVQRDDRQASVRVAGRSEAVIPWLSFAIHSFASGPVEQP